MQAPKAKRAKTGGRKEGTPNRSREPSPAPKGRVLAADDEPKEPKESAARRERIATLVRTAITDDDAWWRLRRAITDLKEERNSLQLRALKRYRGNQSATSKEPGVRLQDSGSAISVSSDSQHTDWIPQTATPSLGQLKSDVLIGKNVIDDLSACWDMRLLSAAMRGGKRAGLGDLRLSIVEVIRNLVDDYHRRLDGLGSELTPEVRCISCADRTPIYTRGICSPCKRHSTGSAANTPGILRSNRGRCNISTPSTRNA